MNKVYSYSYEKTFITVLIINGKIGLNVVWVLFFLITENDHDFKKKNNVYKPC